LRSKTCLIAPIRQLLLDFEMHHFIIDRPLQMVQRFFEMKCRNGQIEQTLAQRVQCDACEHGLSFIDALESLDSARRNAPGKNVAA